MEKYESYIVFTAKKHCRNEEILSRQEIDSTLLPSPPPPLHPLHGAPLTTPIPHAWPGWSEGNTSLANITTVVEMQSKPLPLSQHVQFVFPLFSFLFCHL